MKYIIPLLFFLCTACDPCDCDDCCVDTTSIQFRNALPDSLSMSWYVTVDISQGPTGPMGDLPFTYAPVVVPPGETVELAAFIAPAAVGALSGRFPFEPGTERSNFDSLHVLIAGQIVDRFIASDCADTPLCESGYNKTVRQLKHSTATTYLYIYE